MYMCHSRTPTKEKEDKNCGIVYGISVEETKQRFIQNDRNKRRTHTQTS